MAPRLIRRFTEMLGMLDRGSFENKCNAALSEALETLQSQPTEKGKASVTITFDFSYTKGMVSITPSIKSKLPESDASGPMVFWPVDGALSTQHPSQIDIEDAIREAPKQSATAAS